ncbi:cuticle protein CP1876-like [Eriocheir sinensis]|uniref:cuticle protein CP1876-like n=1 Tax=Eriocheir sinensis TaxID=95602 RepID=UPI0021C71518|nr:cuticle protein CP1876-like [Eriocheir sinensis]
MKTLVMLAVMMAVSAHQASANPGYGYGQGHGSGYGHGYSQPRYVGPLASSVPAGIGGKIIPVSDTYEVTAARDHFARAYKDQLNTISAIRASRYGSPSYGYAAPASYGSVGPKHVSHAAYSPAVHVSHAGYGAPSYGHGGVPTQVRDTPEVEAAKADFFRLYNKQAAAAAAAPDNYAYAGYKHY